MCLAAHSLNSKFEGQYGTCCENRAEKQNRRNLNNKEGKTKAFIRDSFQQKLLSLSPHSFTSIPDMLEILLASQDSMLLLFGYNLLLLQAWLCVFRSMMEGKTSKLNPVMYIFSPEGFQAHERRRRNHVKFEFQDI